MTLGQRISLYRKKLNISQEELGARLGVSRQAVSKWETDLSAPDLNNLIGLARELGVSVAELTETAGGTGAAEKHQQKVVVPPERMRSAAGSDCRVPSLPDQPAACGAGKRLC